MILFAARSLALLLRQRKVKGGSQVAAAPAAGANLPPPDPGLDATPPAPVNSARRGLLRPGGHLVAKVLQGPGFEELVESLRPEFNSLRCLRAKASRQESKETFLIGMRRRNS